MKFKPTLLLMTTAIVLLIATCPDRESFRREEYLSNVVILENANVVDVDTGAILEQVEIVIDGATIKALGRAVGSGITDARRIDLKSGFVIPGLIESHAHVSSQPEKRLTYALEKGVVALRDMGGDGAYLLELQQAVRNGELNGPDIYFSAIMGGPQMILHDSRVKLATPPEYELGEAPWARLLEEGSDTEKIVSEARACGVTGIKLYAHLSASLVAEVTREAHAQGLKVWAHAVTYPATAEDGIEAGVDVISHAAFFLLPADWCYEDGSRAMDASLATRDRLDALLDSMASNGVALDPTLVVGRAMLSSITDRDKVASIEDAMVAVTRAAHDRGIVLVAGTDCPLPESREETLALHEEMELLVTRVGLTPLEALRAATTNGAEALGISDRFGRVAVGQEASLVVLERNPLVDIHNIEAVDSVLVRGRFVAEGGTE